MTKEKFLSAYNMYLPNKYIRFVYKLNGTNVDDKKMKLEYITKILLGIILFSFISTIFEFPENIIKYLILTFIIIIIPVIISIFIGMVLNMRRIKKITKILNLSDNEFINYARIFLKNND